MALQAAPPFAVFEGCEERLPIKDSKPAWGSMSVIAMLRSPTRPWHRIGVAHALGVFQICVPKVNERRRTHEVIPPHLSVSNLLCRSNNCDPENKIGSVRNQVRQKESPRKADGIGLNKPQSQPSHETQDRQGAEHKRIYTIEVSD